MAKARDFNPKAIVVVRKVSGLSLGGQHYSQGQAISDDCISVRKKLQLYRLNILCHPHETDVPVMKSDEEIEAERIAAEQKAADEKAEAERVEAEKVAVDEAAADKLAAAAEAAQSEDVKPEADNGDDADKASETQEGEGESSESGEPEPVVKKKRVRKPRS